MNEVKITITFQLPVCLRRPRIRCDTTECLFSEYLSSEYLSNTLVGADTRRGSAMFECERIDC